MNLFSRSIGLNKVKILTFYQIKPLQPCIGHVHTVHWNQIMSINLFSIKDTERIRKKAGETHKERVEKFNNYLNSLSEHYEQSKVSWTK